MSQELKEVGAAANQGTGAAAGAGGVPTGSAPAQETKTGAGTETARTPEQGAPPYRRRYGRDGRPEGPRPGQGEDRGGRRPYFRKKVCKLCLKKAKAVDYKDVELLRRFVTDRGKILPRRITGTCAKHQRMVSRAIMRARMVALLPFVSR